MSAEKATVKESTVEKALPGRIDSGYCFWTINDKGLKTIEAQATVRDQSPEAASKVLLAVLAGLTSPATEQVEG